jgi:hypothetical protein
MKQMTIDMLESVESENEDTENFDLIRYKIRTALNKSPTSEYSHRAFFGENIRRMISAFKVLTRK